MAWNWLSNRIPGYQLIAERLRLGFIEKDEHKDLLNAHRGFKLFENGTSKKIKCILTGMTALQEHVFIFEYAYTVSTGKSSHTYTQHVYSVNLLQPITSFRLKPQNILHNIGKWFGMQDIDFTSYEGFNKNYLLQSNQETEIRQLFSDQVLGFLNYEQKWCIESSGTQIIYYKFGKRMNEEMVEPFIQVAGTLHALLVGKKAIEDLSKIFR